MQCLLNAWAYRGSSNSPKALELAIQYTVAPRGPQQSHSNAEMMEILIIPAQSSVYEFALSFVSSV